MILGFTGTRSELTPFQVRKMRQIISHPAVTEFHHGDCVGADQLAHRFALEAGKKIVIHPPIKKKYRAWCLGIDVEWWPEKDYLARDRDIVKCCEVLLAVPKGPEVKRGSGTWYTIRYARKRKKRIRRLMP
jgi:hypothetical protein